MRSHRLVACSVLTAFLTFAAAFRNLGQNLWGPHRYGCLNDVQVSSVISGPCAAHSLLITTEGKLWSWGESDIHCIPLKTRLEVKVLDVSYLSV